MPLPPVVADLLDARPVRDAAWQRFLEAYSELILRATRSLGGDADDRMDRYAFVLDQLRSDDCRRLRTFRDDGRAQFTTWLVLVVQRLCVDEHRRRHGRLQSDDVAARDRHEMRRRLEALIGEDPDVAERLEADGDDPDLALRTRDLLGALDRVIGELPPAEQLILRLRFEDGRSVPTIARMVGAPSVGHVYRRLDALLAGLRARLAAAGVRDPQP